MGGDNEPELPSYQIVVKFLAQASDQSSVTLAIFQEDTTNMDDSFFWRVR